MKNAPTNGYKGEMIMRTFLKIMSGFFLIANAFGQSSIIIFNENPSDDSYYDASWGFCTSPSQLEMALTSKIPVDAGHPYMGRHSIRLRWNSQTGGNWGIAIAAPNWTEHDVTGYDSVRYWINAPDAIDRTALPDLLIEDILNNKSTRAWLGTYFQGVDGDTATWQKVSIPLKAFKPGAQNADFKRIKTLYHLQKNADGVEHIAWLDEIRFVRAGGTPELPAKPAHFSAVGHDSRIDLAWNPNTESGLLGYQVYRSSDREGPYARWNNPGPEESLHCDFIGQNGRRFYYYLTAMNQDYLESVPSDTVSATTFQMTDDQLLTSVQEATFRYFYHYGHPVSGLARESSKNSDICATGGTGFGLMTLVVGAERRFAPRDSVAFRVLKILRFLQDRCTHLHGAWSHWIHGSTGAIIPFSENDDGVDLVETAYLIEGMLTVRQYFSTDNAVENEIRRRATQMWEDVEWDWFRRTADGPVLYWHWSPTREWTMNMPIIGFHEAMIVYLLAIASPTHPVPASLYDTGWTNNPNYANGGDFYGIHLWVGKSYGGPLFFTHYSFMGFDPREKWDRFCNYFENSRNTALIHRAYAIRNPLHHAGYDSLTWGLTASFNPWGYSAHEPMNNDNGTVAPTAAVSSMPYTPVESMQALKNFYFKYGARLWGEYGFRDAFNADQDWFASFYVAIDQGPIVPMIENHRTGLCWRLFMSNPEITPLLRKLGWRVTSADGPDEPGLGSFELRQNFPNPFNSETVIQFSLDEAARMSLEVFDILGRRVQTIYRDRTMPSGRHQVSFDAESLPSGIYLVHLKSGHRMEKRKMVVMR